MVFVNENGTNGADQTNVSFITASGGDAEFKFINGENKMDANFKGTIYKLTLEPVSDGWNLGYATGVQSGVCNLYFNANGGTLAGGAKAYQKTNDEGIVTTLPTATREGYTLVWEDAKGTPINAGDRVTSDTLFFAAWKALYTLTVEGGSVSGEYTEGTLVSISATVPAGQVFDKWVSISGGGTFQDATSASTTFTMPAGDATIKATYKNEPPVTDYSLTVIGGNGSGDYAEDTPVSISATIPEGQVFDKWEIISGGGAFQDATSAATVFTMPAGAAAIKATFKNEPGPDPGPTPPPSPHHDDSSSGCNAFGVGVLILSGLGLVVKRK
jgi:hypothetical protein